MTEHLTVNSCCNCNKLMTAGDDSISITVARERIEDGCIQPTQAHSLLDLCIGCAPSVLRKKVEGIVISQKVFDAVVFNKAFELDVSANEAMGG